MHRTPRAAMTLAAGALLLTGCAFGGGQAPTATETTDPTEEVTLTFQSLAFQDATIAATEEIVDSWNEEHPETQIDLVQGSWDNVHDQLVTQFQGGDAPDIIHNEASDMAGFAHDGYLADLTPYLSEDLRGDVAEGVWTTVTAGDEVFAAPTLMQSYVAFANTAAFEAAGVEVPTGDSLAWSEVREIAQQLTGDGTYGLGWGLKSPTAPFMNLALGEDGTFFEVDAEGQATIDVGEGELALPQTVHAMAYEDQSLDPVTLTQSGGDVLPGFLGGTYGMYIGGSYLAQQIADTAPEGFEWTVLPPLAGSAGPAQGTSPQTLSVSADSEHVDRAAAFIDYYMQAEHLAAVGQGDALIPATGAARDALATATEGQTGWAEMLASGEVLEAAPFQLAVNYPQWKDQYATPAFQQYLADSISLEELTAQLTEGWESIQ
ncbi:extracellular solute-binding protein [Agrococcus sediminis]|uniref:Extracellular solute-binding protein n=1 Tax=Agrococcus sediminis TaxID=2599924 RepID=A0A5M8Q7J8_9MICO|nr:MULTISPECIES: extracellular solute-binding protein [Agrococcus]KAA6431233.1 extracellular solute-binding protein [Agrococcus sediminis]MDR7234840.1 ABC-type glycerol-3-phosphate transport system substrate-binding protein [Agrococcus sp. BE272]